jgi:hypothetical protein
MSITIISSGAFQPIASVQTIKDRECDKQHKMQSGVDPKTGERCLVCSVCGCYIPSNYIPSYNLLGVL